MSAEHPASETPEEQDALAAEYVLGVLDADARAEAARRIARDPAFAAAVESWTLRLADLNAAYASQAAPAALKRKLDARLFGDRPNLLVRLWGSAPVWRGATALAAAAAITLAALGPIWRAPPPKPDFAAALASADGTARFVAFYSTDTQTLRLAQTEGAAPARQEPELWLIEDGRPPVSLGLPARTPEFRLDKAAHDALTAGGTLAVSLEPIGGSPTGQPTGPVVALGVAKKI